MKPHAPGWLMKKDQKNVHRIKQVRNRLLLFPLSTMVLLALLFYLCLSTIEKSFLQLTGKSAMAADRTREFIVGQYKTMAEMIASRAMDEFAGLDAKGIQDMIGRLVRPDALFEVVVTNIHGDFIGGNRSTYDNRSDDLLQSLLEPHAASTENWTPQNRQVAAPLKVQNQILGWVFVYPDMIGIERIIAEQKLDHQEIEEGAHLSIMVILGIFVVLGSMLSYLLYRLAYAALMGDVKKRIAAEYYYAESEANLARAQELTHIGNWKYDTVSGKFKVSRELLKIFALEQKAGSKVYPLTVLRRIPPKHRGPLIEKLRSCTRENKRDSLEIQIDIAGGAGRYLSVIFDHGSHRGSKSTHLFGTVQDITGRIVADQNNKQIQYALYQSSKMASLGLMSASIVHELKNPLTAVMGYAELLHSPQQKGLDTKVVAEKMIVAAGRMRAVVDHLRSYSREEKDTDWQRIDPNGPIRSALQFLLHLAKREDISYELALAEDLPCIKGNGSMLESVFQNLVTNSMDAFVDGKKGYDRVISVKSRLDGEQILIVYEDNAGGMSAEVAAKVFETFFTTKPAGKGTGLGMAITLDIIKEHGGTITVHSELNKGTRFEISLPVHRQETDRSSSQAA